MCIDVACNVYTIEKIPSLLAGFFHFSFALPVSKRKKAIFALFKNNRAYMDNIDLPKPQTEKDGKNFWKNLFRTILGTTIYILISEGVATQKSPNIGRLG